ncbi:lipopolysaccharide biosynthesis protein [Paraliomyxa miuraensis]|uniref:lipopolysaccharide biosynthesis protein n=1 Tax=Paraliomyxa miuraensis TaxID=376150 RepID=UPI00224DE9E7|nr:lipopolysaccharide biosynthesis protein [Paraliomyxa miuraensis]MCX4240783.1 lipopolysaccharide biosynthesis protein [Paraliomyxa miuraensis]
MTAIDIKTLGRSSITTGLVQLWRIASRLVLTPIIIGKLGWAGYGAWTLVFSVAAYVQMTNASFGLAYTKFTAEYVRHRRFDELTHIIGSGMAAVGSTAAVGLAIAWLVGEPLMAWLGVPTPLVADTSLALVIVLSVLVLRMTWGCTLEILGGLQRLDLTQRLNALGYLIEFLVTVPLLLWGPGRLGGIVGLAVGHATGQLVTNLAAYSMVRARLPDVRISPRFVSRAGLRAVMSVGGRFQLLWAVNTIVMQGLKFLISKLVGVEAVAIYDLADKLINLGKTASEAVIAPLMPAFASLRAGGERARERLLFLKGSKADALMGGASFAFLALLAPSLLLLWTGETGPQVEEAAWTLRVLAVGEASLLLTSVVSSSLRAQGRVRLELTWAMITTGVVVVLLFPLAPLWGYTGMIVARLLGQLCGTVWYLRAYFGFAEMTWGEYLRGTGIPRLIGILAAIGGVLWAGHELLPPLGPPGLHPRLAAALEVIAWGVPYAALLSAAVWKLYLEPDDRVQVATLAAAVWGKLRGRPTPPPPAPDVVVVTGDDPTALVEAAQALGTVAAMTVAEAGALLSAGVRVKLVLVELAAGGDPRPTWDWISEQRPDLLGRLAYVGVGHEPFFRETGVRRYPEPPSGAVLRAEWGSASPPT